MGCALESQVRIDLPVEGEDSKLGPPPRVNSVVAPWTRSRPRTSCVPTSDTGAAAAQFDLFRSPCHSTEDAAAKFALAAHPIAKVLGYNNSQGHGGKIEPSLVSRQ